MEEIGEVRGVLLEEIEQHRVELKLAEDELDDLLRASGDGSGDDQADAGAKTAEREHEISVAANARASLRQAEHALEQLMPGLRHLRELWQPDRQASTSGPSSCDPVHDMPAEAGPPLTPDHATSTPRAGVDGVSTTTTDTTDTTTGTVSSRTAEENRPRPDRRGRLFVVLGVVAVLAYLTDQLSKIVALDVLADGEPRPFVGELIRFKLIGNPGAALSLGASNTWVMTGIALAVLVAIIVVARQLGSRAWAVALGLLLGAAIGNLTDRFVRPAGRRPGARRRLHRLQPLVHRQRG